VQFGYHLEMANAPLTPKTSYTRPELQHFGDLASLTLGSPGSDTLDMGLPSMDMGSPND
jgi:hypothetical protein